MPHAMQSLSTLWKRVMLFAEEEESAELAYHKATKRLREASLRITDTAHDLDAQFAAIEALAEKERARPGNGERRLRKTDRRRRRTRVR